MPAVSLRLRQAVVGPRVDHQSQAGLRDLAVEARYQSVGAATGGFVIKNGISANIVWMALVFLVPAVLISVAATSLAGSAYRVLR